jgi:hypothetical protein
MLLSKQFIRWVVGFFVLLAVVAGILRIWAYRLEKNNSEYELVVSGNASEAELVRFLDSGYDILVSDTLTQLERRKLTGGREKAAKLLASRNASIWYPAALYLGVLGDQRSVPYLIRGLHHPAWRSRPRVVSYLQTLTGQNYGDRKEEWIKWWSGVNINSRFDFTCITTQEFRHPR